MAEKLFGSTDVRGAGALIIYLFPRRDIEFADQSNGIQLIPELHTGTPTPPRQHQGGGEERGGLRTVKIRGAHSH